MFYLGLVNNICFLLLSLLLARPALATDLIRINGTGSAMMLMKPLSMAYGKVHPEVEFKLDNPLGSSGAIKALLAGVQDIALSSRDLTPEEASAGANFREYAKTPLAIITNKGVDKNDLTTQELVDIYAGKTMNWPDGKPVRLILRPMEDTDTKLIRKLSPEMDAAMTSAQERRGMTVAVNDSDSVEVIAKTPGALGASGLTVVIVKKLPLNVMSLNLIEPTPETLFNGAYPLAKPLGIVTLGTLPEPAKKFLAFVYSQEGRGIAQANGARVTAGEQSPW